MINLMKKSILKGFDWLGYEIRKKQPILAESTPPASEAGSKNAAIGLPLASENLSLNLRKIHYGCGLFLLDEWLNVDLYPKIDNDHISTRIDLLSPHPFPDNWFEFGFAEAFLEHLSQADSLIFLSEVYRTLKPGGVLRLSFPCLEGVLRRRYQERNYQGALSVKEKAYMKWGHIHFYSNEELTTVCRQIGFTEVEFVEYGKSKHGPLNALEFRQKKTDLYTYVEITK